MKFRALASLIVCAVFGLLALPSGVLAEQPRVTNKRSHVDYPTLSAAAAAALPGDELEIHGDIVEPGPALLGTFSGKIKGGSISQAMPGLCSSGTNCVIDVSRARGPVTFDHVDITVPAGDLGIVSGNNSKPLTLSECEFNGPDTYFGYSGGLVGLRNVGVLGGTFTFDHNKFKGKVGNAIVLSGTPDAVTVSHNEVMNTEFTALILQNFPAKTRALVEENHINGGGNEGAFAGIDLIRAKGVVVKNNEIEDFPGDGSGTQGVGIRLRGAAGAQIIGNHLDEDAIGIQIDPFIFGDVSNGVVLKENEFKSRVMDAVGLQFNAAMNPAALYTTPIDARNNHWGDKGPASTDNSCGCKKGDQATGLKVVNFTPLVASQCNNSAPKPGDIQTCPAK